MTPLNDIDILESTLRHKGDLLNILLADRTTKKNIIWATDSYSRIGNNNDPFHPKRPITPNLVTGVYSRLIQPRAAKSIIEQRRRTKEKAEVFTPKSIVTQMNQLVDWKSSNWPTKKNTWQAYVQELRLEITCGEAPFIVSRYNPTAHTGKVIELDNRVGFLDRKLRVVSEYCRDKEDWIHWAKEAYKASYGYEWQGDNLLIARENLLYTMIDNYKAQFKTNRAPSVAVLQEFAEIISWNIFQMDGIKYVTPMSCKHENRIIPGELTLFGETPDTIEKDECEGCKFNRPTKHNGKYVKIMDWQTNKVTRFVDLLS